MADQRSPRVDIAGLAVAANAAFLLALLAVWGRNLVRFRSKRALGLATFGSFLLVENRFALYYYLVDPTLPVWFSAAVPPVAWRALASIHVARSVALGALLWVTMD